MADTVSAVVGAITYGIKWVRQKYREFKVWLADQLVAALSQGWKAALTIAGLIAVSIVVGYVWQIMMQNAIVIAVRAAITNIGGAIAKLAAFLQVDMIIALVQLGTMMNQELYDKLAPLYDELGSLAQELELDFNYITTFLEVDRAILQATSQLTGWGFIEADAKYVRGLSEWLKKLGKRMSDYAADPQLIFTDIQTAITAERIKDANEALGKIWAAIDFAGDWVRGKGEILLVAMGEIDAQVQKMPDDIQRAIKPWYNDAIQRVKDFESLKWDPFWKEYQSYTDRVEDMFLMYGTDIKQIQRRIDDPLDWLRTLLSMPENKQATLKSTFNEFIGKFLPVEVEDTAYSALLTVERFRSADADMDKAILSVGKLSSSVKAVSLAESKPVSVPTPWYEGET